MNNIGRTKKLNKIVKNIEQSKQIKTVEQQFLHDLIYSIECEERKNQVPESLTYKPSGMGCIRQCFYVMSGLPNENEVKNYSSVGICESGTDRHERIQKAICAMRNSGIDCEYIDVETYIKQHGLENKLQIVEKCGMETKIYNPTLNMRFLTDGIVRYKGKYYIFEFKTEISRKWLKRVGIDPVHLSQGCAYSENFGIDEVIFVYENRDTCEKKAYLLSVTPDMRKEKITGFIENCNNYVNEHLVPPMPIDADTLKKCKYCHYKGRCAVDGLGSKQFLAETIKKDEAEMI